MIKIENVSKNFGEGEKLFQALRSIDLEVEEGECVILSGISGSGKSTLLSLMAALDRPSGGKIVVEGELVSKLPDLHASAYRAKTIGVVFQHFNLIESLSVEENVIVPLINSGLDIPTIHKMAEQSMQRASILHKSSQDVSSLSGGEKQRCAIARALVHDPKVILCDEPTANLDRENSLKFIETIQELHEAGKTIVVATHDPLFETLPFESRVVHMEDGVIGSISE
ncbi:ABC transporter ATP-binding protein [Sulfurovum mangrovi]|uniref:ABC transporter ATP-binding protein n=1 Tax=Sulfurovum mangrovi TaxID=2893889 RepID=UPI001E3769D0|nr:ABC transporter ATP-binding protein [Sulfurovum mangrovi]UFH59017.1 ABC transporter ATP-binding protein [Sulfurovum mangrovi]